MILDWNVDDWCIFLKKLDQMNVYESRSTVPNDVKKWLNECDAAIELRNRQTVDLMSEVLHLTVIRSNALTVENDISTAAPDAEIIRCTDSCFDVSTLLHLMPMPSDALTIECDVRHAAPGRETVRCTLTIVCWRGLAVADYASKCDVRWLHPMLMHQMHWQNCLSFRKIDDSTIVWLSGYCIRPWNNQMHAGGCLWRKPVAVEMQRHWRWSRRSESPLLLQMQRHSLWCRDFAFNAEIVECTDNFVCFIACYRAVKRTNCWFNVKKIAFDFERLNALTILFFFSKCWNSTIVW